MLPPDYFTEKEDRLIAIYQKWQDYVMKDIAAGFYLQGR